MDPLAYMRGLAEFWGQGGKAFAEMTERLAKGADPQAAAFPGLGPGSGEFAAANAAFAKMWASATDVSAAMAKALHKGDAADPIVTEMLGRIFDPRLWFSSADK